MNFLLESQAYELLKSVGIQVPDYRMVYSIEDALNAAEEIGYPVVMKIVSHDIVHKSDVGGVKVDIKTPREVIHSYEEIFGNVRKAVPDGNHIGILMAPMIKEGIETIIGAGMDAEFGRFILFGLGGIYVELFKDVSFRLTPISRLDANDMIKETKAGILLEGFRNQSAFNTETLKDLLMRCSELLQTNDKIEEMDLNPIMINENGIHILDARIRMNDAVGAGYD